ncbi:MAG TPA: PEP-CTERM sorting domain-containing protein [Phycisphaerae bacterium]|nr:PEP-CTERM sorting domain-containing protein [Phycisphaerae bacterium]HNU44121.1 PEP-CTERM sorting domain-containing protein [Phycisphaerae bacterium]
MNRRLLTATGVLVLWLPALPAVGAMIDLRIDPAYGSTEDTGATARLQLTFTESEADDLLSILIENTTPPALGSSLTAIGLELPDWLDGEPVFAVGGASAYFDELMFNVKVSPSWLEAPGGYDLMLTSDGRFEGGKTAGAPRAGQAQTVMLNLGDTGMSPSGLAAAFRDFYAGMTDPYVIGRFQAVGPRGSDSDKVLGMVPEPGTLLLMALGMALVRRR